MSTPSLANALAHVAALTSRPLTEDDLPPTAFWRSRHYCARTRKRKLALWAEIVAEYGDALALQDAKKTHTSKTGRRSVQPSIDPAKNRSLPPRVRPAPVVRVCKGPAPDNEPAEPCGKPVPARIGQRGGRIIKRCPACRDASDARRLERRYAAVRAARQAAA